MGGEELGSELVVELELELEVEFEIALSPTICWMVMIGMMRRWLVVLLYHVGSKKVH